jgi:AAA15 family ATPase/GTPase
LESAKSRRTASVAPPRSLIPEATSKHSEGVFLIDEIENGIHYTVLPQLWQFLFRMAKLHNVQVFATTHSWDCVEAFQKAAAEETEIEGTLIRLEKRDDCHKAVTFSEKELAIVTRDKIEVR